MSVLTSPPLLLQGASSIKLLSADPGYKAADITRGLHTVKEMLARFLLLATVVVAPRACQERYCRACAAMDRGNAMFNKCRNLLRKPHCCQMTLSGALGMAGMTGTSELCRVSESERSYYDIHKEKKVDHDDNAFELSLEELKFIDIEGL